MTLTLATATTDTDPERGKWILAIIAALFIVWYVFACWFWPFRACPWCSGTGRWKQPFQAKTKKRPTFRACHVCKATGKRLRLGRRVFNLAHKHHTRSK